MFRQLIALANNLTIQITGILLLLVVIAALSGCRPGLVLSTPDGHNQDDRPNVLLVVIDDLGFTDLGSYGSEIRTPSLDALAERGLRFSNYYVSPNCAPTRSMLFSGVDHHLSGNGTMLEHIGQNQRGQPGYEGFLNFRVAALPELLQDAGYDTFMAGKWHLGITEETSPTARGFDKSYALLLGGASHFSDKMGLVSRFADAPYRKDGITVGRLEDGFYSTTFYTDQIIDYIDGRKDTGKAPFFAYLSYTAVHWPLQVPDDSMELYKGIYDGGYDELRRARFAGAKRKGIVPREINLGPKAQIVTPWDDLNTDEKRVQAKKMEIYSAMLELVDNNIGRLLEYLEQIGELDNTLVIVMSDNGAEGNPRFGMGGDDWVEMTFDNRYESMGRMGSYVYLGPGWGQASSAPFKLWKAHTTEGGIRAPMIVAGPGVNHRGDVTDTLVTVRDLMPTILEISDTRHPGNQYKDREVLPMTGKSIANLLNARSDAVHAPDEMFGWEIFGGRAIRQGDWKLLWVAGPNGEEVWKLFNITTDPGETMDIAAQETEKLNRMKELWLNYIRENNVLLPESILDNPWGSLTN